MFRLFSILTFCFLCWNFVTFHHSFPLKLCEYFQLAFTDRNLEYFHLVSTTLSLETTIKTFHMFSKFSITQNLMFFVLYFKDFLRKTQVFSLVFLWVFPRVNVLKLCLHFVRPNHAYSVMTFIALLSFGFSCIFACHICGRMVFRV